MTKVYLSPYSFKRITDGLTVSINGVRRFVNVLCINIDDESQTTTATVVQVGGIFTKDAAIRKLQP